MSVQKCECGNVLLDEEEQTNELCAACVKRFEAMTAQSEHVHVTNGDVRCITCMKKAQSEPLETNNCGCDCHIMMIGGEFPSNTPEHCSVCTPLETPSELYNILCDVMDWGSSNTKRGRSPEKAAQAIERLTAEEVRKAETRMLETPLKDLTMEQKLEAKQLIEYSIEHHATLTNTESKDE